MPGTPDPAPAGTPPAGVPGLRAALGMAWHLRPLFAPYLPAAAGILLLAVVQADLLIAVSYLTQRLLDSFIGGPANAATAAGTGPLLTTPWLQLFTGAGKLGLAGGLALTAVIAEAVALASSQWRFRIAQAFRCRLQEKLVAAMLRASGEERRKFDTASAQALFAGDSSGLGMFLIFGLLGFIEQVVRLGILTAALCRFGDGQGWYLAAILVPAAIASKLVVMKLFLPLEQKASHASSRGLMDSQRLALQFFPLMARLVYLKGERDWSRRVLDTSARAAETNRRFQWLTSVHGSTAQILTILALPIAAMVMLGMAVSPGVIAQGQALFASIIAVAGTLVLFPGQIAQYTPALARITGALAVPEPGPRPPEIDTLLEAPTAPPAVRASGLRFTYHPDAPAQLQDITFEIPPGALVCLTGATASGKSTIARILIGELHPDEGTLALGPSDVTHWHLWWRRELVAFLPAEVGMTGGSLLDHLKFGRPDIPDDDALASARACGLGDTLDKYGTAPLHSPDTQLSTGEQRRIGVARLLLGKQPVWILDEPLANLDPRIMRQVADAITRAAGGRTVLVITHDPAYFDSAFNIFLHAGKVAATGKHAHLLATCEAYRHLYQLPG